MPPSPTPMRVLFVTPLPGSTNTTKSLRLLASDTEIELVVATCEPDDFSPSLDGLPMTVLRSPEARWRSSLRGLRRLLLEYRYARLPAHLRHIIASRQIDLVHAEWLTSCGYFALHTGFKPVIAATFGSDVLNNPYVLGPHTSRRLRRRLCYVARHADAVYTNAQVIATTFCTLTGRAIPPEHIFPHLGVDTTFFRPAAVQRAQQRTAMGLDTGPLLVWTRSFSPVYAPLDLIHAVARLAPEMPGLRLRMVGDGPLRARCARAVADLGLEAVVQLADQQTPAALAALYQAADLYVSTSVSDGSSHSLMEALACGLPVVVSDIPANGEWVTDGTNGWRYATGKVDALAHALRRAVADRAAWPVMAAANRHLAETRAELHVNYAKLKALYRSVLATAGRGAVAAEDA